MQCPEHTMTISRAGKMPRFARVLKKASLFCGCNVCEKAQNSLTKFTWEVEKKNNRCNRCWSAFDTLKQTVKGHWQKHHPQALFHLWYCTAVGKLVSGSFSNTAIFSIPQCEAFPKLNKWKLRRPIEEMISYFTPSESLHCWMNNVAIVVVLQASRQDRLFKIITENLAKNSVNI